MRLLHGSTLCADSFVCRAFCRDSCGRIRTVAVEVAGGTLCLTGCSIMRLLYGISGTIRFCLCSSGFTLRLRSFCLCTRLACIAEGRRIDIRIGDRLRYCILNRCRGDRRTGNRIHIQTVLCDDGPRKCIDRLRSDIRRLIRLGHGHTVNLFRRERDLDLDRAVHTLCTSVCDDCILRNRVRISGLHTRCDRNDDTCTDDHQ